MRPFSAIPKILYQTLSRFLKRTEAENHTKEKSNSNHHFVIRSTVTEHQLNIQSKSIDTSILALLVFPLHRLDIHR